MTAAPVMRVDGPMLVFGGPYSNLGATEAVLREAARLGIPPRRVLCTGDVVAYGAHAAETLDLVMASGIAVLAGNCEEQLAAGAADCGCGFDENTACDLLSRRWFAHARRTVRPDQRRWMAALPRRITVELPDGRRLAALHGGATETSRFLFNSAPDEVLAAELARTGHDGVLAGHCGLPFARTLPGGGAWINAGAVGMPANDGTPRGWFALLTPGQRSLRAEFLPLRYDHEAAAAAMRAAHLPQEYAAALETGLWPSLDVLPPAERDARGRALSPPVLNWRAPEA